MCVDSWEIRSAADLSALQRDFQTGKTYIIKPVDESHGTAQLHRYTRASHHITSHHITSHHIAAAHLACGGVGWVGRRAGSNIVLAQNFDQVKEQFCRDIAVQEYIAYVWLSYGCSRVWV